MCFELFFTEIISMIEHLAEYFVHIFLVFFMVEHMGVPHEVCQFVGNDDARCLRDDVEKLQVLIVASVEF
jgi:hypothetical protein